MVNVTVKPVGELQGVLAAPASKSYTQRMLIAAALSDGVGRVIDPLVSEDTLATFRAITAFGAQMNNDSNDCWVVRGTSELKAAVDLIDVGESGATLRFMIPIAALTLGSSVFLLSKSLERRPIDPLLSSLKMLDIHAYPEQIGDVQAIAVEGKGGIAGGRTSISGDVSSQFISGLIFACPMAKSDTEIQVTTPLESKNYVKMTQEVLAQHQIDVQISEDYQYIHIPGRQTFRQVDCKVPGDFSSAAFLLASSAITNSNVKIDNLNYKTTQQGDKAILDILKEMGVNEKIHENSIEIQGTNGLLKAVDIDAKNIPDLVPICTVLSCYANGKSKIFNAQRLKFKESDRLTTIQEELTKMGASISVDESSLTIKGPCKLHGTTINSHNDHRIAMACTVAALMANGETTIENAECIRKSYPSFYNDLTIIGAEIVGRKLVR
ncbi:MAG: 3-phosphoshikimate 1-carboxyvinyltransferase [Nitrososphaerota archaeon]|jgi:3-phosphoshikimate 1-carboxyvinyltransferase|nr:3-phosphoshikimate 1-carboxyvinyltransferase [Nitrososphaerota archaeon]